jgi:RNA-directed DNA polymerase
LQEEQYGISVPALTDRCHQARVRNALEPEWEARFEARSYGFRPGRSCADAIAALHSTLKGPLAKRVWILDADLSAAFDRIDHTRLLDALGSFPAREMVRGWLTAGVVEDGMFAPTEEGTPQGGVISPLLLNVALHGLEGAAGARYRTSKMPSAESMPGTPVLVRYADDLAVCCHSRQEAEQVKARLAEWLAPRGLAFNENKTRIVHLEEGFDFLGFNIRRYTRHGRSAVTLTRPSNDAVDRVRHRLADEIRNLRGSNAVAVIAKLNPLIRGWAAYYRGAASSRTFAALDHHVWMLTYRWACRSHPRKSRRWIVDRYFGRFHKFRNDKWVFGDPDHPIGENGDIIRHLVKFSWTNIVRHTLVTGWASPDDPGLQEYWAKRRRKIKPALDNYNTGLLAKQNGRCPLCQDHLLTPDQPPQSPHDWERWWLGTVRRAISADYLTHHEKSGPPDGNTTQLVHASCHGNLRARQRSRNRQPATPSRLA